MVKHLLMARDSDMNDRTNEILKHLNRLANDRTLPAGTRNKVRDAAQHIKLLQSEIQNSQTFDEDVTESITQLEF